MMGAEPAYRKTENFRLIRDEITRLSLDKKKTPVIIIDEANYVSNAILNDLKLLSTSRWIQETALSFYLLGFPA